MKKPGMYLALLLLLSLLVLPLATFAATAKDTVETEVGKILEQLKDPAFKQLAKEEQIEKIRSIINKVFNYTELSRRTLGREWKKFSPEQQQEFEQLFGKLLERSYADRVLAYTSEKIEFGKETELRKDKVEVESAIITTDNKSIPVYYRMVFKNDQWQVYDVVIEGISLVQNYRSQFREILAKKSPEDLLATLREKVNP
jgi:phospholipid transport system substrate-binding protein